MMPVLSWEEERHVAMPVKLGFNPSLFCTTIGLYSFSLSRDVGMPKTS